MPRSTVAALVFAYATSVTPAAARPALRVLFIGNSHTYTYDVPGLVERLSRAAGGDLPQVQARSITVPGACLADHLRLGAALAAIRSRRFDVVVLQECGGGIALQAGRFHRTARVFDGAIRAAGARTVIEMVHSYRSGGNGDTARIAASVRTIARQLGATVAPDGIAWQKLHRAHPEVELFGPDGYHPSPAGAYLHACTLLATLACAAPAALDQVTLGGEIPEVVAGAAWAEAWRAVRGEPGACPAR